MGSEGLIRADFSLVILVSIFRVIDGVVKIDRLQSVLYFCEKFLRGVKLEMRRMENYSSMAAYGSEPISRRTRPNFQTSVADLGQFVAQNLCRFR